MLACERSGRSLADLTLEDLRAASPAFGDDASDALDVERAVARRASEGGTGHDAVRAQLVLARDAVADEREWLRRVRP